MYRSVLVPLDGSRFAEHALTYARPLARRSRSTLHLVLAHAPLYAHAAELVPPRRYRQWEDTLELRERSYLERLADRLRVEGLDVEAELREGAAARTLVERTRTGVDLVIMATRAAGGVERLLTGSVADQLVRHVDVPVLLVHPSTSERPAEERVFRHILAATDGSRAAEAAVEHAALLARLFGARLTLQRVVSMPVGLESPYIPHTAEADRRAVLRGEDRARRQLRGLSSRLETPSPVATLVTRAYQTARGILTGAADVEADLIAVGTHRRLRLARAVLGSTADRVVRGATVPVLVAHDGGEPAGGPTDPIVA